MVGALRTADIVEKAKLLRKKGETYDEIWETKTKQLEKLDEDFLAIAEDLGKLVANKYCDDCFWPRAAVQHIQQQAPDIIESHAD